jgi:hypothetical protein
VYNWIRRALESGEYRYGHNKREADPGP